jgi:hypothetical protein
LGTNRFFRIPELILCFFAFFLNFFWEVVHTYFYTLKESPFNTMLYGWLHCTLGDVVITLASFWVVSLVSRSRRWLLSLNEMNFLGFIGIGVMYTFLSEWANVRFFKSWGYNDKMPMIPLTGIGLTPVLQWIVVPAVVIFLARDHLVISQPADKGGT